MVLFGFCPSRPAKAESWGLQFCWCTVLVQKPHSKAMPDLSFLLIALGQANGINLWEAWSCTALCAPTLPSWTTERAGNIIACPELIWNYRIGSYGYPCMLCDTSRIMQQYGTIGIMLSTLLNAPHEWLHREPWAKPIRFFAGPSDLIQRTGS